MSGALTGLRVLELAAIGPAPFAAMMLADMGAEVVRVDRIPADPSAPSAYSTFDYRGRSSVAVDLKKTQGVDTVLRLVERADILLEGFRPGVTEKLGLGPEVCLARNPALIYGRMTGWGQTGPLAHVAGHDLNYVALTGALQAMGHADRPPTPPLNLVGDYGGGAMLLLTGVLAALFERHRSGRGQVIDAAMTDGVAAMMTLFWSLHAQGHWTDRRESNQLDGGAHYYGVYETADGKHVSIGSIEPQFYRQLLRHCGLEQDPVFQDQTASANWPALKERLTAVFKTRTRAQWCETMEGTDVCFAPVLTLAEAPLHPHNQARQTYVEINGCIQPAPAPRFSRTPSHASHVIPSEGQDSRQVLEGAGFTQVDIERLLADAVVFQAPS